jgi:hypothetical protein
MQRVCSLPSVSLRCKKIKGRKPWEGQFGELLSPRRVFALLQGLFISQAEAIFVVCVIGLSFLIYVMTWPLYWD